MRSTTRSSRDHDGSHDGSGAWEARAAREGPEHAATQQEEEEGYGDEDDDDDGDGDDDDGGGDGCVAVSIGCAGEWSYEWDVVKLSGGKCKVRRDSDYRTENARTLFFFLTFLQFLIEMCVFIFFCC